MGRWAHENGVEVNFSRRGMPTDNAWTKEKAPRFSPYLTRNSPKWSYNNMLGNIRIAANNDRSVISTSYESSDGCTRLGVRLLCTGMGSASLTWFAAGDLSSPDHPGRYGPGHKQCL